MFLNAFNLDVDLSHYVYFEQIDSINQRIIMIGDIHGMKEPFESVPTYE